MEWREIGKLVLIVNPDEFRDQFDLLSKPGQHPMVLEEKRCRAGEFEGRKFQLCGWQPYDPEWATRAAYHVYERAGRTFGPWTSAGGC